MQRSHSFLMFGRRPVRLPWLQEGRRMVLESKFKLNKFPYNFTECVVCSRWSINHASCFFPCCILELDQHHCSYWKIKCNSNCRVSFFFFFILLSSWTTRRSPSFYVISIFVGVRMLLRSAAPRRLTRPLACCYMHAGQLPAVDVMPCSRSLWLLLAPFSRWFWWHVTTTKVALPLIRAEPIYLLILAYYKFNISI